MPREYREIHFSRSELAEALHDYTRLQTQAAHPGNPSIQSIAGPPEVSITLQAGRETVVYNAPEITAALIRLAKKIGVPLPREARKALDVSEEDLTLKLWID